MGLGKSTRAPSAQEPSALEPAPAQCVKEMSHSLFFCVFAYISEMIRTLIKCSSSFVWY